MTIKHLNNNYIEKYDISRSPFAQNPTQKDFASLLGLKKGALRGIIAHKEQYIVRRTEEIGGKIRQLCYPASKYRGLHEKLKFHLNKICQPDYLFSPRKGKSIRSNAEYHIGQRQYLKIDIKQFYPSTTSEHVFRWAKYKLKMRDDVAGLFTHIATIDNKVAFGSPLTPVLTSLIYRDMFDAIANECYRRGLRISIWVDDICISGKFVPGVLLESVRSIIRSWGLKSHKLNYSTGSRSVIVTGVAIRQQRLDVTRSQHNQISDGYGLIFQANTAAGYNNATDQLLSRLGRSRYICGSKTPMGRKISSRMNDVRQKRRKYMRNL